MIINDISSVTFSNHYKWNSFEAISQDFIEGLLIENENIIVANNISKGMFFIMRIKKIPNYNSISKLPIKEMR